MSILEELGALSKDTSLDVFLKIGESVGAQNDQIVSARDAGQNSRMLSDILTSGLASAGCSVRDAGIVPAPAAAFAAKGRGAGLMICPPGSSDEFIGIKFWNSDSTMFSGPQISALKASVADGTDLPPYRSVGSVSSQTGAVALHQDALMRSVVSADCPVVLDCASNCASLIAPGLLSDLGCDLIAVNSQLNAKVSSKYAGIDEGSLRDLADIVGRSMGEIGIAIDGDGSRIAGIDESARYMNGEVILALFAEYLDPRKIVVPVTASMMIDDLTDGEVIRVPAGDANISGAVKEYGADFGGSPSGSFIFPKISYSPDGIHSAALLAKIAGEGRLNEIIDSLPKYYMEHASVRYDGETSGISERISENIGAMDSRKVTDTDGWRVEMDGGWYLIRFSTKEEQTIRITAEARDEVYMISLMDIAEDVVADALK